jgi:hypothetical protein
VNRPAESDLARVRAAATELREQIVYDPLALTAALEEPIAVQTPSGELDSWFVALTVEGRVLGFLQLEPDLSLHRYSTFQRTPGDAEGCPPADSWLDPDTIRDTAGRVARADDHLGQPVLGYDGNRDRIAWRVPIIGKAERIYVAGEHAYREGERQ